MDKIKNQQQDTEQKSGEPSLAEKISEDIKLARDHEQSLVKGFDMIKAVMEFLHSEPFFGAISRQLTKISTERIPTMGVGLIDRELALIYNPVFSNRLSNDEMWIVLKHEFYHILMLHLGRRRKPRHVLWNIAGDLAINSLIDGQLVNVGGTKHNASVPNWMLVPGRLPVPPPWAEQKTEEKQGHQLAEFIKTLPEKKAAEWYYDALVAEAEKNGSSNDDGDKMFADGCGTWDDHELWNEDDALTEEKIRQLLRDAVNEADKHNRWGTIPEDIRVELRRLISREVDWRSLLKRFVGRSQSLKKSTTIKRVNRKYPYVHPGFARQRSARVAVAIDQSGSMNDVDIALLFAELDNMARYTTFVVVPFDASVSENEIFTWKKGQKITAKRVKCGGTDFDAPTEWANKHSGEIDGLIVLTDGAAPRPKRCKIKRAWVTIPGCKIIFESEELVLSMKRDKRAA